MATAYSRALEEQLRLYRSVTEGFCGRVMRATHYMPDARYGPLLRDGRLDVNELPASPWEKEAAFALLNATPYYWSSEICTTIASVAPGMPPWRLDPKTLPSHHGFCYFERLLPYIGIDDQDQVEAISALLWNSTLIPPPGGGPGQLPAISITTWAQAIDADRPMPFHYMDWIFGETPADAAGRFGPGTIEGKTLVYQILAAMLVFMDQRILMQTPQTAERATRRRLERADWKHEPVVRAIELRRRETSSNQSTDHASVDWSHRWLVSGHWRNQWYPSLNDHRPRWVLPYVKGPDDKPLKPPRARIFAVVR